MQRRHPVRPALAVLLLAALAAAQPADAPRIHDPVMISSGEWKYVFSTGGCIQARRSRDFVRWERVGSIFDRMPEWTAREVPGSRDLWAPDISFRDGKYWLYYSVSTFGRNRSCIGLATNQALDPADPRYRWVDHGKVIESTSRDDFNAIDPNIVLDEQSTPWLSFGSFWSGIKLIRLDPATGAPPPGERLHALATRGGDRSIEAPFIIRRHGYYWLFVSFDACCRGVQSTYRIMVGRSKQITGPYMDLGGRPMLQGGGALVLAGHGAIHGPGHNAIFSEGGRDWIVHHYYNGLSRGRAEMQVRPLLWDEDQWPLAGEPITSASEGARDKAGMSGRWDYRLDYGEARRIELCADGSIGEGMGTWSVARDRVVLRWGAGDRQREERCLVGPDGAWFVGRNRDGQVVYGRKLMP